ncbi:MAG TPA: dTDP-4-dehydrorhamnose reductase [Polyangiaceae bacterium]|jgi:dTDP-4-dehydrorhamnose reductase|nr:dTDP-4-dehydrorhamnose reductase [Polyangiaceae bacterium]
MMPTVLVFGSGGQLGQELLIAGWPQGVSVVACPEEQADITDDGSVAAAFARFPATQLVVNAAAYTAVDRAETDQSRAFAVNRDGPLNLALACSKASVPLVHISTDYVFDGSKQGAYVETDPTDPISVYGASKLAGEQAVLSSLPQHVILRTSWMYSAFGHNFVKTMLRLAAERESIKVVSDQFGCPTSAQDLAHAIAQIAESLLNRSAAWGTYHCAGTGGASWYELAAAAIQSSPHSARCRVLPIPSSEYPTAAQRPMRSILDSTRFSRTFGVALPSWRQSLEKVVAKLSGSGDLAQGRRS